MTTLEQVIAAVETLPPAERRNLRQWLHARERHDDATSLASAATAESPDNWARPAAAAPPRSAETVEQQIDRFRKAMKWIDEHRAEYLDQWVALEGDRLISHGPDALQVDAAARAAGITSPFLEQVLEEEKPFCGGWT